ncbi:TonB-dependent receptor [Porticoccaceae bacterium]|nr:TonB-dependent receptor [Porticoccaceae bacterium]
MLEKRKNPTETFPTRWPKQPSSKKTVFYFIPHLRFFRRLLLPNMRPVRKRPSCVKPPTRRQQWKKAIRTVVLILACGSHGISANATDSSRESSTIYSFNIPSLKVEQALSQLAENTGHQLLFSYELVNSLQSNAVKGDYTATNALQLMLQNTPLTGTFTERGVIIITSATARKNIETGRGNMNTKKTLLAAAIGMFAAGGTGLAVAQEAAAIEQSRIDEIIVTAQKRETSLQDTAMSISALTGEMIEKRGLVGMSDYLSTVPGVTMQDRGAGQNSIIIRGLSADPQSDKSTTGTYFGEIPTSGLGNSSTFGGVGSADIKMVDIERVEVLRGPQGTLYGSGSMGGTVRIIPAVANLEKIEGKVAASFSQTGEEGGDNTMLQAVLNVPLIEDKLAIRGVFYQFDNSGYVKNVAASQPVPGLAVTQGFGGIAQDIDDVGNDNYTGLRLSTLWHPIEPLEITLSYLHQKIEQDGTPEVGLSLAGDYQQRRLNTGVDGSHYEFLNNDINLTNLVIEYDFGWATITNSTSLVNYDSEIETDVSHIMFAFASFFPGLANQPYFSDTSLSTDNTINELRLVTQFEGSLQFTTGLYYENKKDTFDNFWAWSGEASLDPLFKISDFEQTTSTKQKAFFGEISYVFSEKLKATVGGRHFDYSKIETPNTVAFGFPSVTDPVKKDETGQTYKANLSYQANDNTLLYGGWSEGFRLGRGQPTNPNCSAAGIQAKDIDSDTSTNFELGFKISLADNRITLNTSLYQINWKGIPVFINPAPTCFQTANAGKAKSKGIEVELQSHLTEKLRLDFSASYGESTLEETSNIGNKGDNLPGSADVNATAGLQYDFTLKGVDGFARFDYSYLSDYYNNVNETGISAGNFGQLNAKAGILFDQITVDLFIKNVTNGDGITWVDTQQSFSGVVRANRIRPRTIGINIGYQF